MKVRFFIHLILSLHFLSALEVNAQQKYPAEKHCDFKVSDSINTIQFRNTDAFPIEFSFEINGQFPISESMILDSVSKMAEKYKVSLPEAAWRYVVENTYHAEAITSQSWLHDPILFLNSVGGGLCDDRAAVLASIWRKMGFPFRIIGLEGHVVPEVFYEDDWHLFDPDQGVYYTDEKGNVLSVSQLESNLKLISDPTFNNGFYLNPLLGIPGFFTHKLAGYYESKSDNRDITEWSMLKTTLHHSFVLPSHSALQITFNQATKQTKLILHLSWLSKGKLKLPFVPAYTSGIGEISMNGETLQLSNLNSPFNWAEYKGEIEILNVQNESTISFQMNDKLRFLKAENDLYVIGHESLEVTFLHKQVLVDSKGNSNLFFDTARIRHSDYLSIMREISAEYDIAPFLESEYKVFLDTDSSISNELKKELLELFPLELQQLKDRIPLTRFKEYFPVSVFYFFLALRYDKMDLFFEYVQKVE